MLPKHVINKNASKIVNVMQKKTFFCVDVNVEEIDVNEDPVLFKRLRSVRFLKKLILMFIKGSLN